jgi:hypothetical protein
MKAGTPSPRGLGKRSEGDSRTCLAHRCARVRGGTHAQLPRRRARLWARQRAAQEVRRAEWSEWDERHGRQSREVAGERCGRSRDTMERRDEVRTALVFYGRWAGIAIREEGLAVEHRGSDRDTPRAVQAEAQKEVTRAIGDASGLERVMREVIQMRSSVSQSSRKHLGENEE